jgi:hypothetical protein
LEDRLRDADNCALVDDGKLSGGLIDHSGGGGVKADFKN